MTRYPIGAGFGARAASHNRRSVRNPVAILIVVLIGAAAASVAGDQALPNGPEFEVASVKRLPAGDRSVPAISGGPGTPTPRRVRYHNLSLTKLISDAYGLYTDQVIVPKSMTGDRYALEAVLPAGTTREDFKTMFRNLLVQRFGIEAHRELRQFQVFDLVIGPGGPKLRPSTPPKESANAEVLSANLPRSLPLDAEGCPVRPPGSRGMVGGGSGCQTFRGATMREFASQLSRLQAYEDGSRSGPAHVYDRTGLDGEYDFELRYNMYSRLNTNRTSPTSDEGPGLADALKSVGLRLETRKESLEVLIVDKFNRIPADN